MLLTSGPLAHPTSSFTHHQTPQSLTPFLSIFNMKFFAVAAVAMAAMVSAQSRSEIPSCALPCLDDSVKKETSCATDDFKCVCSTENFTKVQGDATTCVISKCGQDTALSKSAPRQA